MDYCICGVNVSVPFLSLDTEIFTFHIHCHKLKTHFKSLTLTRKTQKQNKYKQINKQTAQKKSLEFAEKNNGDNSQYTKEHWQPLRQIEQLASTVYWRLTPIYINFKQHSSHSLYGWVFILHSLCFVWVVLLCMSVCLAVCLTYVCVYAIAPMCISTSVLAMCMCRKKTMNILVMPYRCVKANAIE